MSSIRETIEERLAYNGYRGVHTRLVDSVTEALEARERGIHANLLALATSRGLDAHEAREALRATGLTDHPDAPAREAEQGGSGSLEQRVATLEARLADVEQIAREARSNLSPSRI